MTPALDGEVRAYTLCWLGRQECKGMQSGYAPAMSSPFPALPLKYILKRKPAEYVFVVISKCVRQCFARHKVLCVQCLLEV